MTGLSITLVLCLKKAQARLTWWNFDSCLVIGHEWCFAYFRVFFVELKVTLRCLRLLASPFPAPFPGVFSLILAVNQESQDH